MKSPARLLLLSLLATFTLLAAGCATDDDAPRGPSDNTSSLPWNRPLPGTTTSPMGALPFQSH